MKILLAASPGAAPTLAGALRRTGNDVQTIHWSAGYRPNDLQGGPFDLLLISALSLDVPSPEASDELIEFPRHLADLARLHSLRRIIYMVPEVRGLPEHPAVAFRSSVLMMKKLPGCTILRTGFLIGTGGLWGGRTLPGCVIVPGQGHGQVNPVLPRHIAAAVNTLARDSSLQDASGEEKAVASCNAPIPLADLLSILTGRRIRLHLPISIWKIAARRRGWSLEAEALSANGQVSPSRNDLEELTGTSPRSLDTASPGKETEWLAHTASSR